MAREGSCVLTLWATTSPVSLECSAINQYGGETKRGPLPAEGKGIWRCLSLKELSRVELLDSPWQTEPHARQRCVDHVEVDADDYPGGDPQNGQRGSC